MFWYALSDDLRISPRSSGSHARLRRSGESSSASHSRWRCTRTLRPPATRGIEGDAPEDDGGRGGGGARALGRQRCRTAPAARPRAARVADRARPPGDDISVLADEEATANRGRHRAQALATCRGAVPLDRRPCADWLDEAPGAARSARSRALRLARCLAGDTCARRLSPPQHPPSARGRSRSIRSRCSASRSTTCRPTSGTRSRPDAPRRDRARGSRPSRPPGSTRSGCGSGRSFVAPIFGRRSRGAGALL